MPLPNQVYNPSMPRRIAFVTTCRNRTQHLRVTLPRNIADNTDYPNCVFVVLSYGDQPELDEFIWTCHAADIYSGKLVYYRNLDPAVFKMSHAKNQAHRAGILEGADILVSLDADNFTGPGFASYVAEQFSEERVFLWAVMIKGVLPRGINGRIAVSRNAFLCLGGYDEKFEAWSGEDKDFNLRLVRSGYIGKPIDPRFLNAIPHTDKMRFREYRKAGLKDYYDQPEDWFLSEATIVNYGKFGCGTVFRSFSPEPIELAPIPTRVFGIGMHKTATTSLHMAMEILGFDSGHWKSAHWAKTIWREMNTTGKSPTLERTYHLCDLPIPLLMRHLDTAYPGSKFILTMLEEETWLRAAEKHWDVRCNPHRARWDNDPFTNRIHEVLYGTREFSKDVFLARYRRHNNDVMDYFQGRSNDLLIMEMNKGAGWSELCGFLGKPVPSVPYPHGNPDAAGRHWIHAGDFNEKG